MATAPPVRVLPGLALAYGAPGAAGALRALGVPAEEIGTRLPGREYAVVFLPGRFPAAPPLESFGGVLWRGPTRAVLEFLPRDQEALWSSYSILPLWDRPVCLEPVPARRRPLPAAPETPDPIIEGYVAGVDTTRMIDFIRFQQEHGFRRSFEPDAFLTADSIAALFRSFGLTDVSYFDFNDWSDNIVAVQRGILSPEEIYIIDAHYDSFSRTPYAPGADDNGSGTVTVLEAARLLAPDEFEATIIYLALSGEEQGLVGSERWAQWAAAQGLDIRGVINLDMIAWRHPADARDLDLVWDARSRHLRDYCMEVAAVYLPGYPVIDGFISAGTSDHQSFWDVGYPALDFNEDSDTVNPCWHTPEDLLGISVNDIPLLRSNVQVAVALLASLARPVAIRILHTPLSDPPPEADGYPVRARILTRSPLLPESLLVRYRVDGEERPGLRMFAVSDTGDYAAIIPRQEAGRVVEYQIRARDDRGRSAIEPPGGDEWHRFVVGLQVLFADDFREDLGWSPTAPGDDAVTGVWVRAKPVGTGPQPGIDADADSTGMCFVTGNGLPGGAPGDSDVDGGRTTLTSPRFALSGVAHAELEYWRWYVDETALDDTLRVLVSSDDGESWVTLEEITESERSWKRVRFDDLGRLIDLTDRVRLRFVAEDVGLPSMVEAAVDRVSLKGVRSYAPLPPYGGTTRIVRVWPNPLAEEASIAYDLEAKGAARLLVFDAAGRRVRSLRLAAGSVAGADGGRGIAVWDGRDDSGRRVPSGVYLLRLDAGETGRAGAKVLVLR